MYETIYEKLKEVARKKALTNYTEVGALVGLEPHNPIPWGMLDQINRHEYQEGRHMLSAVVIVQEDNKLGEGFFKLARKLGLFLGDDELTFWVKELNKVWGYWSSH